MNNLLANLGFILQLAGFFIFIVAIIATLLNEVKESIAFFITASTFFLIGFPLNALSERKEINFKDSLILFFLTFLFLGIIGSIPYIFLDLFDSENLIENIVNSIFESVSGFTTTGFTFLKNKELSNSMIIYRATSQFVGGIGIVYLLLTFLYSSKYKILRVFSKLFFSEEIQAEIKKNVAEILAFFGISTIILGFLMYSLNNNLIKSFSLVMSGISTGGFPHYEIKNLSFEERIIIILSMILGSISIFIISKLKKELPIYILMILICIALLNSCGFNLFDSTFHAISLVSTTGYSYIEFSQIPANILLIFSLVMLIGGMAISTAGGMKIIRLVNSVFSVWKIIKIFITEKKIEIDINEIISLVYLFLFLSLWIIVTIIFSFYYMDCLEKSLFDMASSLSTSGFSISLINQNLPIELKIILILIMILARVEILPLLAFFIYKSKNSE